MFGIFELAQFQNLCLDPSYNETYLLKVVVMCKHIIAIVMITDFRILVRFIKSRLMLALHRKT